MDFSVSLQSFYGLIKQWEEYVREMGIVEGQDRYFQQGCLHKCRHRRECLSMTVCQSRDACLRLSQEGPLWSRSQNMHETASVCSHHALLLWTGASVSASQGQQQVQTQHNCCCANRIGQICTKISFLLCCAA